MRNINRQRAYNAAWDHELIPTTYNTTRNQKSIPTAWNTPRDHEQCRSTARNAQFRKRAYNAAWDHEPIPTAYKRCMESRINLNSLQRCKES